MLLIDTLRKKKLVEKGGELIADLTSGSYKFTTEFTITNTVVVTEDFEMRPDLAARSVYGNSNQCDYLMKFNGISNPFSLEAGRVLLVIEADDMRRAQTEAEKTGKTEDDIRSRFFDQARLSKKDQKRLDYIKKKAENLPNASGNNLPPNFAEPGSKEIVVLDGKVVFGGNVTASKDSCPVTESRAKTKAKLIEKRIWGKK